MGINLLQIDITWPQLKALHQVYEKGSTRSKLFANPYFERLRKEKRVLKFKSGNLNVIEGTGLFDSFYLQNFLNVHERYQAFFNRTGVEADGRRAYKLYDLETLMYIERNKAELAAGLTTERTFASQLFNSSKYLENNLSVRNAVLRLLQVEKFPASDPKNHVWRLVVDCPVPLCIVLCENLDNLKCPETAIERGYELWYVGGNNTGILANLAADKLILPIYYRCDWDYDGLRIYGNVKKILAEKGKNVCILEPAINSRRLQVDSPYHFSKWKVNRDFSGLDHSIFTDSQSILIKELIAADQWIEEESQDFGDSITKLNDSSSH
jgi:hypothetical protein